VWEVLANQSEIFDSFATHSLLSLQGSHHTKFWWILHPSTGGPHKISTETLFQKGSRGILPEISSSSWRWFGGEEFQLCKKNLDLNNAAYEIVWQIKIQDAFGKGEALDHNDDPLGMDPGSSERCHILHHLLGEPGSQQ
jgi:hypothetical protein